MLERAYEAIARELADGQLVGIFPEGKLTADGEMNEFRSGVTKILERTPVPVISNRPPEGRRAGASGGRHAAGAAGRGAYSAGRLEMKGSRRPSSEVWTSARR